MNLKTFSSRLLVAVLLAVASGANAQQPAAHRAVLLVTIDGLHPSYVLQADALGLKIPVLRELVKQGAHASGVTNVNPTVTYPNHTTLLTGVGPETHGIHTNTVFDPEGTEQEAWNWYGAQIKAPTLWDAAKSAGLTTASVLWPVSVAHPAIDYNVPEFWRTKTPDDHYLLEAVSTPRGFLEGVEKHAGGFIAEADEAAMDERITEVAVAMIEQARPELLTVHIVNLDGVQHASGPLPQNPQARQALEEIDAHVGRIIAAERVAHPDATIAIASDHGFLPVEKTLHLNAAFSAAGLIELDQDGKLASWKAYAWNSGGSASVVLKDPGDSATYAQVDRILTALAADAGNGIASVLRGKEAIDGGALPQASFLVDCQPGFGTGKALRGDVVRTQNRLTGTHGYANTRKEMNSSFFVVGPGIEAGKDLGQIDIRRIAPTLARELNVSLPSATQAPLPLH